MRTPAIRTSPGRCSSATRSDRRRLARRVFWTSRVEAGPLRGEPAVPVQTEEHIHEDRASVVSTLVAGLLIVAGCGSSEPGDSGTAGTGGTGTGGNSQRQHGRLVSGGHRWLERRGGRNRHRRRGDRRSRRRLRRRRRDRSGRSGGGGATGGSAGTAAAAVDRRAAADRWRSGRQLGTGGTSGGSGGSVGTGGRAEHVDGRSRRRRRRRHQRRRWTTGRGGTAGSGGSGSGTCTASKAASVNASGSGPHKVTVETNSDSGIKEGTIFRPTDLGGTEKYPIFVWGEGGCSLDGLSNSAAMGEIASHGYFVIADGTPNGSGTRSHDRRTPWGWGSPCSRTSPGPSPRTTSPAARTTRASIRRRSPPTDFRAAD